MFHSHSKLEEALTQKVQNGLKEVITYDVSGNSLYGEKQVAE